MWRRKLNGPMNIHATSISKCLKPFFRDKLPFFACRQNPDNIVFVFKSYYIRCLIKELGIDNSLVSPIYPPTTLPIEEIINNHASVLCSFGISIKDEELYRSSVYWLPKLHKCLTKSVILLDLTNAPLSIFPNY